MEKNIKSVKGKVKKLSGVYNLKVNDIALFPNSIVAKVEKIERGQIGEDVVVWWINTDTNKPLENSPITYNYWSNVGIYTNQYRKDKKKSNSGWFKDLLSFLNW